MDENSTTPLLRDLWILDDPPLDNEIRGAIFRDSPRKSVVGYLSGSSLSHERPEFRTWFADRASSGTSIFCAVGPYDRGKCRSIKDRYLTCVRPSSMMDDGGGAFRSWWHQAFLLTPLLGERGRLENNTESIPLLEDRSELY